MYSLLPSHAFSQRSGSGPGTLVQIRIRLEPDQGGNSMPKASKEEASESVKLEGYEGHFENLEGGYTVGFETYTEDADLSPFFSGLPDDRCQCPHWGYVIR